MSNVVKGVRITLEQVLNSEAVSASNADFVTPKKATILSNNSGTLIQTEDDKLYIATVGNWFRSSFNGKAIPQVDEFNKLQDMGLTAIKDKVVRHEEKSKVEEKKVEKSDGQEVRSQNNVIPKKIDKAVASNTKSEKKN
jgi:hypothetical protein